MRYRWFLLVCLVMLGACGGAADTAPIERVKEFVAATEARDADRMVALLAPEDRRDAGWQLRQALPKVTELKLTNPQYTLEEGVDSDENTAHVRVSGMLVGKSADGKDIQAQSNQLVVLVKQEGAWYITGNGIEPPPVP